MNTADERLKLIENLQTALDKAGGSYAFVVPLMKIMRAAHWENALTASGEPFADFGDFATHPRPQGLGVCDPDAAMAIRDALCSRGFTAAWVTMLKRIVRPRGRVPKNPTNGEIERFFSLPASPTAKDRLLLRLERDHPEFYQKVAFGQTSAFKAAVQAKIAEPRPQRIGAEQVLVALRKMEPSFLTPIVREVWPRLSAEDRNALRHELLLSQSDW